MIRLVALAALVVACREGSHARSNEAVPEPLAETTHQTTEPEARVGYIGVLTPKEQMEVPAPFTTSVKKFLVNVGDHVDKGTPLVVLDDQPIREQLDLAAADLASARVSRGAAASALSTQTKAFRAGVASKASVTDAEYGLREASAKVDRATAAHDAAKKKLKDTTVVAPIAGKVALHYVKPGGQVTEGSPIMRVISSDELFVKFAIPTDQTERVLVGAKLDIEIDARGQKLTAEGVVQRIAPELDPIAQMIFAEADLTGEKSSALQAGSVCRISLARAPAPK